MREFFLFFPNIVLLLQLIFRYLYDGTSQMVLYFDDSSTNLFRLGTDFICPNKMRYMIVSDTPQNTDPKTCQELSNCRDWAKSKPGSRYSSFFCKNEWLLCMLDEDISPGFFTYVHCEMKNLCWLAVCLCTSVRPSVLAVSSICSNMIHPMDLTQSCVLINLYWFHVKAKKKLDQTIS